MDHDPHVLLLILDLGNRRENLFPSGDCESSAHFHLHHHYLCRRSQDLSRPRLLPPITRQKPMRKEKKIIVMKNCKSTC